MVGNREFLSGADGTPADSAFVVRKTAQRFGGAKYESYRQYAPALGACQPSPKVPTIFVNY